MNMDAILLIFTLLGGAVVLFLAVANAISILGHALHQHRFVDDFQRRIESITALFRMGVR